MFETCRFGRGVRRSGDDERGVALVEMAIVLPLLMLLVFGIIEWGVFISRDIDLTQGVREAGRQGAVALYGGGVASCSSGGPTAELVCLTKSRIGVNGVAVHVIAPSTNTVGASFAVCATYKTAAITGLAIFLPKFITTETVMRLEQAPAPGLTTGGDADPQNNAWSSCAAPQ